MKVEIYYNPYNTKIDTNIKKVNYYNIFNGEKV